MPCTSPVDAWRPRPGAESRRLVFSPTKGLTDQHVLIPCGACTACRLDRAMAWATRCIHERQMHQSAVFITPTYSDEHLPADLSVSVREMQLFNRRLRHEVGSFRFFCCGEYGDRTKRPHYHALLFGLDFDDKKPWAKSKSGELLYRSPSLERIWGKGSCLIGSVTLQSAGYCARYSLKKITGEAAAEHYRRVHPVTGEVCQVRPEFIQMSRAPGIGYAWFQKFRSDAFPSDFVIVDGQKRPVPPYYLRLLEEGEQGAVRAARHRRASRRQAAETAAHAASGFGQARLLTKHQSQELSAKRLVRELDEVS